MSALAELANQLSQWPIASFLRQSVWAYPLVSAAHILSIGLIIGSITTLDLRLLGMFRALPVALLATPLTRVAKAGVVLTLLSGFLLFSVQPGNYLASPVFQIKLLLMTLGILNALIVHRLPQWQHAMTHNEVHPLLSITAILSLVIWVLTVIAGRWIAFV